MMNTIKKLLVLLFYTLSALVNAQTSFDGLNTIIEKGEITVSFTPNNTPIFTEVDNLGNVTGIDMELAQEIAKNLGVKLNVRTTASDWNSVIDEVSQGKADFGISYLSITMDRSKKVLFSNNYVNNRQVLIMNNLELAKQKNYGNRTLNDMVNNRKKGARLGVLGGSSYEGFAKNLFLNVNLKRYNNTSEIFEDLLANKIGATLIDELELYAMYRKNPGGKVKLTDFTLKDQPDLISIAVNPKNHDLLTFINNNLRFNQVKYNVRDEFEARKR